MSGPVDRKHKKLVGEKLASSIDAFIDDSHTQIHTQSFPLFQGSRTMKIVPFLFTIHDWLAGCIDRENNKLWTLAGNIFHVPKMELGTFPSWLLFCNV